MNMLEKQMGCRVAHESRKRAAVRVSIEAAEGRICRVGGDTASSECGGIGETQMTVGAQDENRPVAPCPVEFRERRIATALVLVQPVSEKPLAGTETFADRLDSREQRLAGLDVRGTHVLPAGDPSRVAVGMAV